MKDSSRTLKVKSKDSEEQNNAYLSSSEGEHSNLILEPGSRTCRGQWREKVRCDPAHGHAALLCSWGEKRRLGALSGGTQRNCQVNRHRMAMGSVVQWLSLSSTHYPPNRN